MEHDTELQSACNKFMQKGMSLKQLESFLSLAYHIGESSTCAKSKREGSKGVGALLIQSDGLRVIATGYNGAVRGAAHCLEVGCDLTTEGHCVRTEHAERNALYNAAYVGVSTKDCFCVCTHAPCWECARGLYQAGISLVFYDLFPRRRNALDPRICNERLPGFKAIHVSYARR